MNDQPSAATNVPILQNLLSMRPLILRCRFNAPFSGMREDSALIKDKPSLGLNRPVLCIRARLLVGPLQTGIGGRYPRSYGSINRRDGLLPVELSKAVIPFPSFEPPPRELGAALRVEIAPC